MMQSSRHCNVPLPAQQLQVHPQVDKPQPEPDAGQVKSAIVQPPAAINAVASRSLYHISLPTLTPFE
jgi:hypothetical protein